jgi:acid phosphatase type 7
LEETAKNDAIDFVFAQLHHPFKSELWIPGEEEFSGKVVKLLEDFSTKTGKPSIHFFGHTHGYSRGQSKDHKHLWINVASAGGAIDNWGEFEGRDYDEFTMTQDEYGFVMVEVDGDKENPKFTIKRISRGNEIVQRDNEKTDQITIYKKERKPATPLALSPNNETVDITGALLKAGPFKSTFEAATHAATNWQVAETESFEKPIFDSWKQSENWYYLENRQKNDDLTDEMTRRLSPNKKYFWRVRYRDQNLNWSDWSGTKTFQTAE